HQSSVRFPRLLTSNRAQGMNRLILLCVLPALAALLAFAVPAHRAGRWRIAVLVGAAAMHLVLSLSLWDVPGSTAFDGWLEADALGLLVLTLFFYVSATTEIYTVGYIRR